MQSIYLILFNWCGLCKVIKPYLIKEAAKAGITILCVNVDENDLGTIWGI
jgi:hypothetical protein